MDTVPSKLIPIQDDPNQDISDKVREEVFAAISAAASQADKANVKIFYNPDEAPTARISAMIFTYQNTIHGPEYGRAKVSIPIDDPSPFKGYRNLQQLQGVFNAQLERAGVKLGNSKLEQDFVLALKE
ncbi:MAG: hypothetical protein Q9176_005512 [Flavoplaca citrina]